MKVLAIDPGSEVSGMLVWDGSTVLFQAVMKNAELLIALHEPEVKPDVVACEMIQAYGMAVGASPLWNAIGRYQANRR